MTYRSIAGGGGVGMAALSIRVQRGSKMHTINEKEICLVWSETSQLLSQIREN